MQVFIFLLLASCKPSTSIEVDNRENSRLQTNFRSGEFFHTVGDWFNQLKYKIYENLYGQTTTTTPSALPIEALDLDKFQLKTRLKHREWLQVNLSSLTFNPDQDWGFHIGNWYFIRKGLKNQNVFEKNNSDEPDFQAQSTIQPTNPAEVETGETPDDTSDPETTEFSSIISTTTAFMTQTVTQLVTQETTIQNSTQVDSSENFSSKTEKWLQDGSNNDFAPKGSVEVLMG